MDEATVYEIRVRGRLEHRWVEWFSGMAMSSDAGLDGEASTLTGEIVDQAELRGMLERIWDLNLTVISLSQIGSDRLDVARSRPSWEL